MTEKEINKLQPLLKRTFKNLSPAENFWTQKNEIALLWGIKEFRQSLFIESLLKAKYIDIFFIEDGFYRSVTTGLLPSNSDYFSISHSFVIDGSSPHYDGNFYSDLSKLLLDESNEYIINQTRNKWLMEFIKNTHLTKYNYLPYYPNLIIGSHNKKVLVVMQSYGDSSVSFVGGNEDVFERMITDAILENSNADILIKVHPDSLIVKNSKKYNKDNYDSSRVFIIDFDISIVSLIEYCSKIYVFSSQVGFEALLYNKDVVCYGKPFYSGIGLTSDRGYVSLKKKISFDKLFYDVHYRYTQYFDPENGTLVTPEIALADLSFRTKKYHHKEFRRVLIIKLDGIGDWEIFSRALRSMLKSEKFRTTSFFLLGDIGYKSYFMNSDLKEKFLNTWWIKIRGNSFIKKIYRKDNFFQMLSCYLHTNLYIKNIVNSINNDNIDTVLVSCWNNRLQYIINDIVYRIKAKYKYSRMIFNDIKLKKQAKKIYTNLLPISGDHFIIFREQLEKSLLSNFSDLNLHIHHKDLKSFNKKIIIFAGAFDYKRKWNSLNYIQLAHDLLKIDSSLRIRIFGLDNCISEQVSNNNIEINEGIVSIKKILEAIQESSLYIGSDTGFYHVSMSNGLRCIVLSNGNSRNTFLEYPYGDNLYIYHKQAFLDIQRGCCLTKSPYLVSEINYTDVYEQVKKKIITILNQQNYYNK